MVDATLDGEITDHLGYDKGDLAGKNDGNSCKRCPGQDRAASFDYVRPYWDEVGVTIAGRHAFDITDGWDGTPPSGIDHGRGESP